MVRSQEADQTFLELSNEAPGTVMLQSCMTSSVHATEIEARHLTCIVS